MFDYNPFREIKEQLKNPLFKTKEDVMAHWNLVHLGDGRYQHASGVGHIYDEEELNHMQKHGVMLDRDPKVREHYKKMEQGENNV